MLGRIGNQMMTSCEIASPSQEPNRYIRNELDDMKKGIEYLYEFKEKLLKLHPAVQDSIEHMLQRIRY